MKHILRQFLQREAHPFIQFVKYAIAGAVATAVDVLIFYLLSWKVFPALGADDPVVKLLGLSVAAVDIATRSTRYIINRAITFIFSNLTAYVVNILWVFKPGRHKLWVEIALFYAVSITSYVVGVLLGWLMIRIWGLSTTFAYAANMLVSLMINYACRKYIVFKG